MGFNIKNNYGPNIEVNDGGKVVVVQGKDGLWHAAEPEETDFEEVTVEPAPDANKPTEKQKSTPVEQETFADRVKSIICKAATKNGQRIETSARGNAGAYIFNIDDGAFCRAMDEMVSSYGDGLKEMLGGTMNCVQVTKVCSFIGNVVRMHVINDVNLQTVDLLFAFEDYYDNMQTVQAKLGDKKTGSEQDVIYGTFEGLLRKYKA
jgi:hypothetical protein